MLDVFVHWIAHVCSARNSTALKIPMCTPSGTLLCTAYFGEAIIHGHTTCEFDNSMIIFQTCERNCTYTRNPVYPNFTVYVYASHLYLCT